MTCKTCALVEIGLCAWILLTIVDSIVNIMANASHNTLFYTHVSLYVVWRVHPKGFHSDHIQTNKMCKGVLVEALTYVVYIRGIYHFSLVCTSKKGYWEI